MSRLSLLVVLISSLIVTNGFQRARLTVPWFRREQHHNIRKQIFVARVSKKKIGRADIIVDNSKSNIESGTDGESNMAHNRSNIPANNAFSNKELTSNSAAFMASISSRAENSKPMHRLESRTLNELITYHVPNLSVQKLCGLVSALGALNSATNGWNSQLVQSQIIRRINELLPSMTAKDMAGYISGMVRLRCSWHSMIRSQDQLENTLSIVIVSCTESQLGDIMWGLGSMGARYEDLNPSLRHSILAAVNKNVGVSSAYSLSSLLWALAKTGFRWQRCGSELNRSDFIQRVRQVSVKFSPQQSSKVAWSLGTIGVSYKDLPEGLLDALLKNVGSVKKSQIGDAMTASHALTGVAKVGTQWATLSTPTKGLIWEQFTRVCHASGSRGIPNGMWAMGTMGATIDQQSFETTDLIMRSSERVLIDCNSWGLCNILWGLAKMRYQWEDLSRGLRDSIMMNIVRVEDDLNSLDCGTILWSLSELDMPLDTAPDYFQQVILRSCERTLPEMKASDLARTMWGLSGTGITWNMLPFKLRWNLNAALRRVSCNMTPQEVANSAYSLCLLAFDAEDPSDVAFRGAHEALLTIIKKAGRVLGAEEYVAQIEDPRNLVAASVAATKGRMDAAKVLPSVAIEEVEQLRIFAHYLTVMQYVSDTKRVPEVLLKTPQAAVGVGAAMQSSVMSSSKLQERVVRGLEDALNAHAEAKVSSAAQQPLSFLTKFIGDGGKGNSFRMESEFSSFHGVFPIDAVVLRGEKIIALLEVDGPHHYQRDGRLRRKDRLKESMYCRQHPNSGFHRIRWDDERKIGSNILAQELVELIVNTASRDDNIIADGVRAAQKSMADFFSWSMRNSNEYR